MKREREAPASLSRFRGCYPRSVDNAAHLFESLRTPADIASLIAAEAEGQHLDYKAPVRPDRQWRDSIAKAACAFANADGGVIVIGVDDAPRRPHPFPVSTREVEDLQRALTTAIEPYPSGLQFRRVGDETEAFLVVLVPQSFEAPHALMRDGLSYPRRRGESSEPMRPGEIADMFGRRLRPVFELFGRLRLTQDSSPRFVAQLELLNVGGGSADRPAATAFFTDHSTSAGDPKFRTSGIGVPWNEMPSNVTRRPAVRSTDAFVLHPGQRVDFLNWEISDSSHISPPFELTVEIYATHTRASRMLVRISEIEVIRLRSDPQLILPIKSL